MDKQTEDRIWLLVSNKLAGEADGDELMELNNLLKANPDAANAVGLLTDYWVSDQNDDPANQNTSLFDKLKDKLK